MALSVIGKPDILFLDEPCSSLDLVSKEEITNLILMLNKKHNFTVILTSHNFEEVKFFRKNILYLKKNNIEFYTNLNDFKISMGILVRIEYEN